MIDAIDELVEHRENHPGLMGFHKFHRQSPEVLAFLIEEIETRMNNGQMSFSFLSLWHYCRWKVDIGRKPSTFKLNDRFAPFYARAIVILRPDFNGWAEFRNKNVNKIFGLDFESEKQQEFYARRVVWADGTALEDGWRPMLPHVISFEIALRPDIHARGA